MLNPWSVQLHECFVAEGDDILSANPSPTEIALRASGDAMMLCSALATLPLHLDHDISFYELEVHSRPIPEFVPGLVLVSECLPRKAVTLWCSDWGTRRVRRGRARHHGEAVGRGRGRGGRGRGRAALGDAPAPLALSDADSGDTAESESEIDEAVVSEASLADGEGSDTSDRSTSSRSHEVESLLDRALI